MLSLQNNMSRNACSNLRKDAPAFVPTNIAYSPLNTPKTLDTIDENSELSEMSDIHSSFGSESNYDSFTETDDDSIDRTYNPSGSNNNSPTPNINNNVFPNMFLQTTEQQKQLLLLQQLSLFQTTMTNCNLNLNLNVINNTTGVPVTTNMNNNNNNHCQYADQANNNSMVDHESCDFILQHGGRANLNLFIEKAQTESLLNAIEEEFMTAQDLYYYLDYTTAMQVFDREAKLFPDIPNYGMIALINFELHRKGSRCDLYGVIVPNIGKLQTEKHQKNNNNANNKNAKWKWKLQAFMTANEICNMYGIHARQLPRGCRQSQTFTEQINANVFIDYNTFLNTNWNDLMQFESKAKMSKKKKRKNRKKNQNKTTSLNNNNNNQNNNSVISINKRDMFYYCCQALDNINATNNNLFPVVLMENKRYKVHRLLMVSLDHLNVKIGVAFKYNQCSKKWNTKALCLDINDIYNKFKLVGVKQQNWYGIPQSIDLQQKKIIKKLVVLA